jgi:predicted RNA polymerase sigma factor
MRLYDPTSAGPERSLSRAVALAGLQGRTIGILENGKLNAAELLGEVAQLFASRHGCTVRAVYSKSNASAPAPAETLARAAAEVDFLITGLGD